MTSNERKILKCLWDTKGQANIRVVAQQMGFSYDYARLISNSLARAGYVKFADANTCCLLKRGYKRFESSLSPIAALVDAGSIPLVFGGFHDASEEEKAKLAKAGYKTIKDLADVSVVTLIQTLGISLRKAAKWINQAKREKGLL